MGFQGGPLQSFSKLEPKWPIAYTMFFSTISRNTMVTRNECKQQHQKCVLDKRRGPTHAPKLCVQTRNLFAAHNYWCMCKQAEAQPSCGGVQARFMYQPQASTRAQSTPLQLFVFLGCALICVGVIPPHHHWMTHYCLLHPGCHQTQPGEPQGQHSFQCCSGPGTP